MKPFNQDETDFSETALTLQPANGQGFNARIQQTKLREKLNQNVVAANRHLIYDGANYGIF